ncbi:putative F-box protein At4g38870 [Rosa rugosa]|uniref:putative F-box protein At4g38870 n=1 Tax=Rosa rugosa TaxID=74645 RepID=UPI002B409818|nr:putative F-box protein At4g38870 [Rosa rugosa]
MGFKCVCKSWCSLTRGPSFLAFHRALCCNSTSRYTHLLLHFWDRTTRQDHLLSVKIIQDGSSPSPTTHCLTLPYEHHLYLTHSSNGLVLLHPGNDLIYHKEPDHEYAMHIFNPCTRESITLPNIIPSPTSYPWIDVVHLFGFCLLTNEYRVLQVQVQMSLGESARTITFKIFTLGTHSWRTIQVDLHDLPFDPFKWDIFQKSLCVNGSLHWFHTDTSSYTFRIIVVFDLIEERLRAIDLPEPCTWGAEIFELDGCLALVVAESFNIRSEDGELLGQHDMIELWILRDYQSQVWVKETVTIPIHLRGSRDHEHPPSCTIHPTLSCLPLCTIHSGVLMLQVSTANQLSIYVYDMKSKTFRRSEIMLPGWLCGDVQVELLTTYDDENIVPLR